MAYLKKNLTLYDPKTAASLRIKDNVGMFGIEII